MLYLRINNHPTAPKTETPPIPRFRSYEPRSSSGRTEEEPVNASQLFPSFASDALVIRQS
eukprot:scaffold1516_cov192-Alexandrium_tamarense.AAC.14